MIWSFQVSWDRSDRERGRRREVEARWEKVLPGVGSSWAEKNNFDFMLDAWGDGAIGEWDSTEKTSRCCRNQTWGASTTSRCSINCTRECNSLQELRLHHLGWVCAKESWSFCIKEKYFFLDPTAGSFVKNWFQAWTNDATVPPVSYCTPWCNG